MVDITCPWCEKELGVVAEVRDEGHCPECQTTWRYEDEVVELALAA